MSPSLPHYNVCLGILATAGERLSIEVTSADCNLNSRVGISTHLFRVSKIFLFPELFLVLMIMAKDKLILKDKYSGCREIH